MVTDPNQADFNTAVLVLRADGPAAPVPMRASLFASALRFNYQP